MRPRLMQQYPTPLSVLAHACARGQAGQALVEGIVVLLVLLLLWAGVSWLGRLQDMALQAQHASRYAAFALTRKPDADPLQDVRRHYFSGPAHQWSDRRGNSLLTDSLEDVTLQLDRQHRLAVHAQAGGDGAAATLRREWGIEDTGIANSLVQVSPARSHSSIGPEDGGVTGLRSFDLAYPVLYRHTAILTDAGHASSDATAQRRTASSETAWQGSAGRSYALGAKIDSIMQDVDRGWNRRSPVFDWLVPWAGHIPDHHLVEQGASREP